VQTDAEKKVAAAKGGQRVVELGASLKAPDVDTSSKNVPKPAADELTDKGKAEHDKAAANAFLSPEDVVKVEENVTSVRGSFKGPHAEIDRAIYNKDLRTEAAVFGKSKERDVKLEEIKKDQAAVVAGRAALEKRVETKPVWPHIPTPGVAKKVAFGSNTTAPTSAPTAAETAAPTAPTAAPTAAPTSQGQVVQTDAEKKVAAAKGGQREDLGESDDIKVWPNKAKQTPLQEVSNAPGGQTTKVIDSEEEQLVRMDRGQPAAKLVKDLDAFRAKAHEMRLKSRLAYVVHYAKMSKAGAFKNQNPTLRKMDQQILLNTVQQAMGRTVSTMQKSQTATKMRPQQPTQKAAAQRPKRVLGESSSIPDLPTGEVVAGVNNPPTAAEKSAPKPEKAAPAPAPAPPVSVPAPAPALAPAPATTVLSGKYQATIEFNTAASAASSTSADDTADTAVASSSSASAVASSSSASATSYSSGASATSYSSAELGEIQGNSEGLPSVNKLEQEMKAAAGAHDYILAGHLQEELKTKEAAAQKAAGESPAPVSSKGQAGGKNADRIQRLEKQLTKDEQVMAKMKASIGEQHQANADDNKAKAVKEAPKKAAPVAAKNEVHDAEGHTHKMPKGGYGPAATKPEEAPKKQSAPSRAQPGWGGSLHSDHHHKVTTHGDAHQWGGYIHKADKPEEAPKKAAPVAAKKEAPAKAKPAKAAPAQALKVREIKQDTAGVEQQRPAAAEVAAAMAAYGHPNNFYRD
jgi:hypothetical protein